MRTSISLTPYLRRSTIVILYAPDLSLDATAIE